MTPLSDPLPKAPLTRRDFHLILAGMTAATALRGTAQTPPATAAPSPAALDAAFERALRAARADADSLPALALEGVPPAFSPRSS